MKSVKRLITKAYKKQNELKSVLSAISSEIQPHWNRPIVVQIMPCGDGLVVLDEESENSDVYILEAVVENIKKVPNFYNELEKYSIHQAGGI